MFKSMSKFDLEYSKQLFCSLKRYLRLLFSSDTTLANCFGSLSMVNPIPGFTWSWIPPGRLLTIGTTPFANASKIDTGVPSKSVGNTNKSCFFSLALISMNGLGFRVSVNRLWLRLPGNETHGVQSGSRRGAGFLGQVG